MDAYISTAWTIVKFLLATVVYVYVVLFVALGIVKLPEFIRFVRGNSGAYPTQGKETEETPKGE